MKEYALFIKQDGEAGLYCGGQIVYGTIKGSIATSIATLWSFLDAAGERLMELRATGVDDRSVEQTFVVNTLPKVAPEPEPENCYEGRCKHPKNFAGSCLVYLMDHSPQRNC